MVTGSKTLIRDINSTLVLESIINNDPISRANIAKEVGLTKATISAIVANLIDKDLIIEVGNDNTKIGRKPILLSINANAAHIISIDVGVDKITALKSNLMGKRIMLLTTETPSTSHDIKNILVDIINKMNDTESTHYGLAGIALGIHGVINDNSILFAPYYNLINVDLVKYIEDSFDTHVFLENEANLSVLGESLFLQPKYNNIASISIHSGIGLGLLINGNLYTGFSGYAGEIGHTIIEPGGRDCPCGNRGCLEQYASEQVLLKEFKQIKNLNYIDFNTLSLAYTAGDKDAISIFQKFIKYMTICINNILNAYNPDVVIINSSFTKSFPELINNIEAALNSRLNNVLHIYPSKLNESSVLLGGVSMVAKKFLGINNLQFKYNDIFNTEDKYIIQ